MTDINFTDGCAWIAGEYLPIAQAAIPITDTGFTRSDVTYDVAAVWDGRFFRLEDHLARFQRSWEQLRMRSPLALDEIHGVLHECVARTGLREAYVEMILTRGVPRNGDRDPRNFENRFYAFAIPYVWLAKPEHQVRGIRLAIARSVRRTPPDSIDPTVKNFQWGDLVKGLFEAYDSNAHTAVLLDNYGNVTEGPGFNIFAVHDSILMTPPDGVLHGITRATVMELARRLGVRVAVRVFDAALLCAADEVFLTSTAGGVMPVTIVDGTTIGDGNPGALTLSLRERYWDAHAWPEWTEPVNYPCAGLVSGG